MKKYEITLQGIFSFAVEKMNTELTDKQYSSVVNAIKNKTIVFSKFASSIHCSFVPVKIVEV